MKKVLYFIGGILSFVFLYPYIFFKKAKMYQDEKHYDVAIVLGHPSLKNGQPSLIMLSRVEKAVQLWKRRQVDYLIMSGAAVHNDIVEAIMMKEIALALGVQEEAIILETQARNTYQNMMYSQAILNDRSFHQCLIVTSRWHLKRAQFFVNKFKIKGKMVASKTPDYPKLYLLCIYFYESICMMKCHYYEMKSILKKRGFLK